MEMNFSSKRQGKKSVSQDNKTAGESVVRPSVRSGVEIR